MTEPKAIFQAYLTNWNQYHITFHVRNLVPTVFTLKTAIVISRNQVAMAREDRSYNVQQGHALEAIDKRFAILLLMDD